MTPEVIKYIVSHTAPDPPTHLSVKQGPTNDSIELAWSGPASGLYHSFRVQWAPSDRLSVTHTGLTGRILAGMFPGRLYNFTVVTVSGGGASGGPAVISQPVQRSARTSRWKRPQTGNMQVHVGINQNDAPDVT